MGTITSREGYVDQVIGSAYQVVRYVAANMQSIIGVSDALPQLELWMPSIASVLAAMPTISNVNSNLPVITNINSNLTMLSNVNANMAALLNINSNMAALLAIPGVIQAQDFKNSVAVATTANIALTGLQTIDGYSVPVGARVLVKNQTASAENGIYVVATGAWARSSDGAAGMLSTGCQVSVDRGTVGAGKQFRLATLGTITVGTTAQSWVEMSSASNVVGQEDDGTPLTVLAPHELQFDNQHFSLTAVAQGVASALSTEILDAIAAGGGGGGSAALGVAGADPDGNDTDYLDCQYLVIDGNAFELTFYDNDEPPLVGKEAYFQIRESWITDVVANKLNVFNLDGAGDPITTLLSSGGLKFSDAFTIESDPSDQGVIVDLSASGGVLTEVPHDNEEDDRKFVRGFGGWYTATSWSASLYHMGGAGLSKSLVSNDTVEENKLKIKGLLPGRGIELTGDEADNNVTIQMKEVLAENLGYPIDYGVTYKVPCGGFGVVSSATEIMSAFTTNMFYAMPFYVHQPNALLDGIIYQIDATGKPTSGNLEISIGKYNEGNEQIDIIYFMTRPYVDEGAGLYTRPVAPDFLIEEPGLYWLIMRTTVDASSMKMLTLKNDLRYRDNSNVSRVMQQFDRYAVAAMESKSTSLSVGRPSVDYYSWSGVTVCPYVEVSFRYPA